MPHLFTAVPPASAMITPERHGSGEVRLRLGVGAGGRCRQVETTADKTSQVLNIIMFKDCHILLLFSVFVVVG